MYYINTYVLYLAMDSFWIYATGPVGPELILETLGASGAID